MTLNKVQLIGRLTADIEVKKMWNTDMSVANFSLATNFRYKNKEGNAVEETEFHRCVAFWSSADLMGRYLEKWRKVYIEGRLKTRKWEDSNWQARTTTEIIVEKFLFLDWSKWGDAWWAWAPASDTVADTTMDDDLPF